VDRSQVDRRSLLASIGAILAQSTAQAQPASRPGEPIFQHDLPEINLHGWSVTAVEVKYAPGAGSNAHKHPGLTFAYVLEGEIASNVGDDPEKVYKTGEMFMETPGQIHAVSRNASATKPARLLALLLAQKGATLTTPA
jgi:quercetin dioxygenase-like cupin family protein